jgi:hypothetical protein
MRSVVTKVICALRPSLFCAAPIFMHLVVLHRKQNAFSRWQRFLQVKWKINIEEYNQKGGEMNTKLPRL